MSTLPPLGRRRLLQLGLSTGLGLSLPQLLHLRAARTAAAAAPEPRIRACILVFYYGGPSHLDSFDPKPHAPAEVRGEFGTIETSVPGVRFCEHVPHLARSLHKLALIRSLHHGARLHDSACAQTLTGRLAINGDVENFASLSESQVFPSYGATLHYLRRHQSYELPYAALPFAIHNVVPVPCQTGGFLGANYNPFLISGDSQALAYRADMLQLPDGLTLDHIGRRQGLLGTLDAQPKGVGAETARPVQDLYAKAFDLLGSEAVRQALEIGQETAATRERYGLLPGVPADQAMRGQNLLLARRLVEAGVPFVNVYDFRQQGQNWDAHADNFNQHKDKLLPPMDLSLAALVDDLEERGLLESTLVIALGEFGRTPRINANAGRDHWPDCYSGLVAGGGVRGGAVHGASDSLGAYPEENPISPADLAATLFHAFGLDPASEIYDAADRPYKAAEGRVLHELF